MLHASSASLARLARRTRARLAIPFEYAAWHGWHAQRIGPGTWEFRDPRFGQLAAVRTASAGDTPVAHTWARDAIAARIRALGMTARSYTNARRDA